MRVPRTLIVTLADVRASRLGALLRGGGDALSEHLQLAAWLLVERREPASPARPYLDALPRTADGFPLTATPEDCALLDGSLAGALLTHLRARVAAAHATLVANVPALRELDLDELVWAVSCASSRCFMSKLGELTTPALVPYADMINHARGPNTRWRYDETGRAFVLATERDYRAGDEICCEYGAKPNTYLLLHYGFCIDHNEADEAVLGADEQVRVTRDHSEPFAQLMLARLRARACAETAARAMLADAARAGLARFSTTLAEDDALLAGGLSAMARSFVVARRGEKRVLHAWLALAEHGPAELFTPE